MNVVYAGVFRLKMQLRLRPELEILRRDLNERIDRIADSIVRRERESEKMTRQLAQLQKQKVALDRQLQESLARYDSAFVESIREVEREVATLTERIKSLRQLQQMPQAISALEREAGALQGPIDGLRTAVAQERARLGTADANIAAIEAEFKRMMVAALFPGVSGSDKVVIDPRDWRPTVIHGDQAWTFWDAGSGERRRFSMCVTHWQFMLLPWTVACPSPVS
jgi:hypothetical protein